MDVLNNGATEANNQILKSFSEGANAESLPLKYLLSSLYYQFLDDHIWIHSPQVVAG